MTSNPEDDFDDPDFPPEEGEISEEEAHFYHSLISFEEIVREHGMEKIMETIDDDVYIQMFDFFMPPADGKEDE